MRLGLADLEDLDYLSKKDHHVGPDFITAYCVDVDPHAPYVYDWLSKPLGRTACTHHAMWLNRVSTIPKSAVEGV